MASAEYSKNLFHCNFYLRFTLAKSVKAIPGLAMYQALICCVAGIGLAVWDPCVRFLYISMVTRLLAIVLGTGDFGLVYDIPSSLHIHGQD